jgi:hypothetical protein
MARFACALLVVVATAMMVSDEQEKRFWITNLVHRFVSLA